MPPSTASASHPPSPTPHPTVSISHPPCIIELNVVLIDQDEWHLSSISHQCEGRPARRRRRGNQGQMATRGDAKVPISHLYLPVRVRPVEIATTTSEAKEDNVEVPNHHHYMDWHAAIRCDGSNPGWIWVGSNEKGDEVDMTGSNSGMEGKIRGSGVDPGADVKKGGDGIDAAKGIGEGEDGATVISLDDRVGTGNEEGKDEAWQSGEEEGGEVGKVAREGCRGEEESNLEGVK